MKDPAFLFYPGDFTTGTQFFSDEQAGKYIRLLCAQFLTGHLPEKHMLFICKTYDEDIFAKFKKDADGLFYNEVLEGHINKRREYSESRRNNRKGKFKVDNEVFTGNESAEGVNNISKTYVKHMENENVNVNKDKKETIKKPVKSLTDIQAATKKRAEAFEADVMKYSDIYPIEMLEEFINHWVELTASKKQMLWETKETFEINRRLVTWEKNNARWSRPAAGRVGPKATGKLEAAQDRNDDILNHYKNNE